MAKFVRLGLLAAAVLSVAACNGLSGSSPSSAPSQSEYHDSGAHSGTYPGPGTHDPNRD